MIDVYTAVANLERQADEIKSIGEEQAATEQERKRYADLEWILRTVAEALKEAREAA